MGKSKELNPKHKEFADKYLETGNATKSVKEVFNRQDDETNYPRVQGSRLIAQDNIVQYFKDNSAQASSNIQTLSNNADNETVKLNANKDILDRAGYKPPDKIDMTTQGKQIKDITIVYAHNDNKKSNDNDK